jgi:serine/threonine protein kinase
MKTFKKGGASSYDIDEGKEIARGGEGRIIDMSHDRVAKLYLPGISPISERKFVELSELKSNAFIKPDELLYDNRDRVIGFVMKKVPSDFYPLLSVFNKNFCLREGITEKTKTTINEHLIDAVKFAHSKSIVIGDLNPYNILTNDKGMLYFLDVDSYETPSVKHSGILLEDVRDFLYGGDVNVKSDYFALGVLAFNNLTYVHPFKGVCKSMPKLADRMVAKKSVMSSYPDLIVPKCYEPVTDPNLSDQFDRIFNRGERFMLSGKAAVQPVQKIKKTATPIVIKTNELVIHIVYNGTILNSWASKERLVILTDQGKLIIYDVSLKGSVKPIMEKNGFSSKNRIFVHKDKVYSLSGSELRNVTEDRMMLTFNTSNLKADLYGSTLVVVTSDDMYKINLDDNSGHVTYSSSEVFGGRFNSLNSMYQNVSGNTVLFYDKGGVNSVFLNKKVRNMHQSGNICMIETVENESIRYMLVELKSMAANVYDTDYASLRMFDVLNDSLIVMPGDDKLTFIGTANMQEIVSFQTSEVSEDSVIHCTNSGIIVRNGDSLYCMNKK